MLALFPGEPWSGRSPRALTRARNGLFLSQEAQKDDRFFVDPHQFDFWPAKLKRAARSPSAGAPTLLPLRTRKGSGRSFFTLEED